jgi:hypothetical protein
MRVPDIELRWWSGCPSAERARAELLEVLETLGLPEVKVRMVEISDDEQARAIRFPGSPTILVDGQDVVAPNPDEPIGLTCRVYRSRDGEISATPDPDDLRQALQRALARQEVAP